MYRLTEIYNRYWGEYLSKPGAYVPKRIFKAVNQTKACRTSKLGVSVYRCRVCEETKIVYHSCKNRFCPRCGYIETQQWGERLLGMLAPLRHHHVTFTLPEGINGLAYHHPKVIYNALFSAAVKVLKDWFNYKHHIIPGIVAVLHTAGFALKRHIHLHILITGGGISDNRWIELEKNYLTRIDFFRNRFRWEFEHKLMLAQRRGELGTTKQEELKRLFKELNKKMWVAAVQKGMYQPKQIVKYIGRYIKRAPLSEHNIKSIADGTIRFECKNYRQSINGKPLAVVVALDAHEFLKRLTWHVPLEGFHMVRYYGAYHKQTMPAIISSSQKWRNLQIEHTAVDPLICPSCGCELVYCGMEFPAYANTG